MKPNHLFVVVIIFVCAVASATNARAADTAVTLSDVHLCCSSCVKGVDAAVAPIAGVKAVCDQDAKTVAITAPDKETAQKAVNALVAAGYFGKSSDDSIKVEAPSGAKDGKAQQTVTVSGVHLCCTKCVTAVKGVLSKLEGVQGNTVVQRAPTFTVTGDFNARNMFDALNQAGLAGKVATPAPAP
jgi:periplasmic mercuric ion binding protein